MHKVCCSICLELAEEINEEIKEKLSTYKSEGHRRGGQSSQEKYGYSKGEAGKFTGNRKNK